MIVPKLTRRRAMFGTLAAGVAAGGFELWKAVGHVHSSAMKSADL